MRPEKNTAQFSRPRTVDGRVFSRGDEALVMEKDGIPPSGLKPK